MNNPQTVPQPPGREAAYTRWLISQFPPNPEHLTYVEPFANSRNLFFAKRRSVVEVLNDTDGELLNLLLTLRVCPEELKSLLHLSPDLWNHAPSDYEDNLDKACRFLSRIAGNMNISDSAASSPLVTIGGISCRIRCMDHLLSLLTNRIRGRLYRRVEIRHCDPLELLRRYSDPSCLLYVTPECAQLKRRRGGASMVCLMSADRQKELKHLLSETRARVILRGHPEAMAQIAPESWRVLWIGKIGGVPDPERIWTNFMPRTGAVICPVPVRPVGTLGSDCLSRSMRRVRDFA